MQDFCKLEDELIFLENRFEFLYNCGCNCEVTVNRIREIKIILKQTNYEQNAL
jgi:hypothetical protein